MPITNIGAANADLSRFTGEHSGFRAGGSRRGFDFGRLLKERFKMQQKLQEEQLRTMTEARLARRKASLKGPKKRKGFTSKRPTIVYGGTPGGAGSPHILEGDPTQYLRDPRTGKLDLRFGPEKGLVGGGGGGRRAGGAAAEGPSLYEQNVAQSQADFTSPLMQMQWMQSMGLNKRHGGYIPETKKYKLHKGEVVLSPEQTQQAFPGIGKGPSKKEYEDGSLSPYDVMGPGAGGGSALGKIASDIGGGLKRMVSAMWGVDPEDVTDEDVNYFLEIEGQAPVSGLGQGLPGPGGALGDTASALGGAGIDLPWKESVGAGGERKFDIEGKPYTAGEKFQNTLDKKRRQSELAKDRGEMARLSAEKMQSYISKYPNRDNKALEKMVKTREKEFKSATKESETLSKEVTDTQLMQQDIKSKMAQQYFQDKTKRLDTAFDSLNSFWKQATANPNDDLGQEEYAKYGLSMLAPYIDDLAEMSGAGRDETIQGMYRTLLDAYEDPSAMMWIKLRLQGR